MVVVFWYIERLLYKVRKQVPLGLVALVFYMMGIVHIGPFLLCRKRLYEDSQLTEK